MTRRLPENRRPNILKLLTPDMLVHLLTCTSADSRQIKEVSSFDYLVMPDHSAGCLSFPFPSMGPR